MLRRLTAARLPQNSSRATPFVLFCSSTFFCVREMLRISFIAHKKTSYTAGTLCASLQISEKCIDKINAINIIKLWMN